jgi:hypothetical protein
MRYVQVKGEKKKKRLPPENTVLCIASFDGSKYAA